MIVRSPFLSFLSLSAALAAQVHAQTAPAPAVTLPEQALSPEDEAQIEAEARAAGEILVVADRIKGQVDAPQKPIETLSEEDIASYGATSLADLLSALTPQTGSGRGRGGGGMPVMLLNGQRISSFREMRDIPPEAIKKVEILPEEVALRYGYAANQRVVNMILKDKFAATTVEVEGNGPAQGGSLGGQGEASRFSVKGPQRLNLKGSISGTTMLTEAERRLAQTGSTVSTVVGDPDQAAARSLISASNDASLNATWSTGLGRGGLDGAISANAAVDRSNSHALSGLNVVVLTAPGGATATRTFGAPLRRDTATTTLQAGGSLLRQSGDWKISVTSDLGHVTTDTRIERRADTSAWVAAAASGTLAINGPLPASAASGFDTAHTISDTASVLATAIGRPVRLPAGEVSATFKAGYSYSGIVSEDTRSTSGRSVFRRHDVSAGINLGIPLTSRREVFLPGAGDITLNFSAGIDRLSDFGSLTDWSAGLTWSPTAKLNLQASYLVNEQAPDLASLGNPLAVSFNVPVYDFTRNETALVTVTTGGNPSLRRETDRDLKLGLNWQLPVLSGASLIAEYFRNRSNDVTAAFPLLTPAIEAAFPGRVTRDANGRLIAIDRRPVTLASETQSRLRWGINVGGTIGKADPMQRAFGGGMGRPGGGGGGRGGGFGRPGGPPMGGMMAGPFGGRGGQGRWNLSLYHTIQFSDRVLITPNGAVLDLLNGDALSGGGVARHGVEFEGGGFYKGIGLRFSGNYTSPTLVRGSGAPGGSDLRFSSLAKFNLRLFVELSQQKWLARDSAFLRNARLQLRVDNLFDAQQRVTDASGAVPISYQADRLDPKGRFLAIELRKQF